MFQKPLFWVMVIFAAIAVTTLGYFTTMTDDETVATQDAAPVSTVGDMSGPGESGEPGEDFRPKPDDVVTLAPGIDYIVLKEGQGETVDAAYIRYNADIYTADGKQVSSSSEDGSYTYPVEMLKSMVPGLADALLASPVDETRRYWIEPDMLKPGYPEMQDQVHIVDLTVLEGRNPLPAPDNVAAAPEDATSTESGIAYIVLAEGVETDTAHPAITDTVTVHYTGWQTDGTMFDSSELRGEPAEFPLGRLIVGWQQAIPLMTRGDRYRFWIPGNLAYDNSPRPGAPKGTLVFDIELLDFTSPDSSADTEGE